MHLSYQALVLAALSLGCALAQPAHRHQHKHKRDLADILQQRDVNYNDPSLYNNVNWDEVCKNGGCAAGSPKAQASAAAAGSPPPSTSSSSSAAPAVSGSSPAESGSPSTSSSSPAESTSSSSPKSSDSTSGSTGSCNDLSSVWSTGDTSRSNAVYMGDGSSCPGGCTSADLGKKYTSFGGETPAQNVGQTDAYMGNVGSPYGTNMIPLSNCDASGYDYSLTFTAASDIKVALWNKVGDDYKTPGRIQTGASRNAFYTFDLAKGQKAVFAIAPNSQVAFSQACDRNGANGQFDCTWGEADFGDKNHPNDGASGYDRSSIPNGKGNTGLLTVCVDGHECSSQESKSFVSTSQLNTGGDTNIPAGQPAHIKVTMG